MGLRAGYGILINRLNLINYDLISEISLNEIEENKIKEIADKLEKKFGEEKGN